MRFCSTAFQRDLIKMKYYMDADTGAGLVKYTTVHIQKLNVGKGNFSITDYISIYDFYSTSKMIKQFSEVAWMPLTTLQLASQQKSKH